jgi:predicted nucleic acid-binding protein
VFLDSNIFVYATDRTDKLKRKKAREIISKYGRNNNAGVISTQVLQEFYSVATRKLSLPPLQAKSAVRLMRKFEVIAISADLIEKAIDCSILNQISFWDALIVCAAEVAQCSEVLTEDLSSGQVINGITIRNPF